MFYLVIALLIWASSFTAGKYAYQMFDPALVVELRLLIAMLFRRAHDLADRLRQCISHCFGGGFDPDSDSAAKTASGRIEWKFS